MKEEIKTQNPKPKPTKFDDQNRWGYRIVKGLARGEKKNSIPTKKSTVSDLNSTRKNPVPRLQERGKRSIIGDLSCSVTASQVHPHPSNAKPMVGSRELLIEIENLRGLLKESKEREIKLQSELSKIKKDFEFDYENEKDLKFEIEVVELRRINKELQFEKRDLACRVASLETQLANLAKCPQPDIVAKIKEEALLLRHTNEDLCKQVEGLQTKRLNEVEELAYLRWVNGQLRNELQNSCSCSPSKRASNIDLSKTSLSSPCSSDESLKCRSSNGLNDVKKFSKLSVNEDFSRFEWSKYVLEGNSPRRRHSISGSKFCDEEVMVNERRQSDGFMCAMEMEKDSQKHETKFEKRVLRVPNPPPRPSNAKPDSLNDASLAQPSTPSPPPPPPPPPPPRLFGGGGGGAVKRAPQVVELYHSLMKRENRRDSCGGATCDVANARSSMIGEIENRSSYLLAIKEDVETQGEFVKSLIREVNDASYQDIEDVVAFVKWLDDELCFLVDERAVLKHFEWPEKKADTLREAAFGYKDLKKLESEVTNYIDDPRLPCDISLKKMASLCEKMERTIYNLLRSRESLMRICKEFQIPTDWMLDSGIISKVKLGSVKLAKKYMNRVAVELQSRASLEKDPSLDYMLLQGVRFAFRIHQFAGGFDAETMQAFEELRRLAHLLNRR